MDIIEMIRVAFSSIAGNKLRSALTMLGVLIGVSSVILLVSITTGFKEFLISQFSGMGTNLLIVNPGRTETRRHGGPGLAGVRDLTIDDVNALKKRATAIEGTTPLIVGTAEVKYLSRARKVAVLGVDEEFTNVINMQVFTGRFFSKEDASSARRVCTIGQTVKDELFGNENPLGKFIKIGTSRYRIIGLMEKKGTILGTEDLDDLVIIPVISAQRLFNTEALFGIRSKARSRFVIEEAKRQITEIIKKKHGNKEDFTVITQQAMLSTLDSILKGLSTTLAGIAAISLLVGGIGIMNIMLVSVRERTKEIGIRKAVGAKKRDILYQFLVESIILSLLGGITGIMLAFVGTVITSMLVPQIPPLLSLWSVLLATVFSILVGVFFGVYPAYKAAQLHPIEALRYE
ncbi:MAG TPA: ABC transporter permease [bacterium]